MVVVVEEVRVESPNTITCVPGSIVDLTLAFFCLCLSLVESLSLFLHFEGQAPRRRGDSKAMRE